MSDEIVKNKILSVLIIFLISISLIFLVNNISVRQIISGFAKESVTIGSSQLLDAEIDVFDRLFILNKGNFLAVYEPNNLTPKTITLKNSNNLTSLALDQSFAFLKDKKNLEIVVLDNGANEIKKYDESGKLLKKYFANNVVAISTDIRGNVFGITSEGVFIKWDRKGVIKQQENFSSQLNKAKINDLTVDWRGNVFSLNSQGDVLKLDYKNKKVEEISSNNRMNEKITVDFFGNIASFGQGQYSLTQKTNKLQTGQGVTSRNSLIASQRFGKVKKEILAYDAATLGKIIDDHYTPQINTEDLSAISSDEIKRMKESLQKFENLLSTEKPKNLLISIQPKGLLGTSINKQEIKTNVKDVLERQKICLKPRIYETTEEIPLTDRNRWYDPVYPGMSARFFLGEHPRYRATEPTAGNYSIRLGIETDKWDMFVANGVCPVDWVKENVVDLMNEMLENAVDAAGNPVRTRMDFLSWELYDRHYFANFFGGWINYVPPWYPHVNNNSGRDLAWLLRPSLEEVPEEEREGMLIYGFNQPWIGAIDMPCGLSDINCIGAVVHETSHSMELSDLYAWDVYDYENKQNGLSHWSIWQDDVMKNPTSFIYTSYSSSNLNRIWEVRTQGIYNNRTPWSDTHNGAFYRSNHPEERSYAFIFHALPNIVNFVLSDPNGNLLTQAEVKVVPSNKRCLTNPNLSDCNPLFDKIHSQFFKDDFLELAAYATSSGLMVEDESPVTNDQGIFSVRSDLLTRRDRNDYQDTHIHPNRAVNFLIIAKKDGINYTQIVEITQLNHAYVEGQTETAIVPVRMVLDRNTN